MNTGQIFVMAAAGLTSALCYVSVGYAPPPAFLLAYVAPLPILIAGLGWGVMASSGAAALAVVTCLVIAGLGTGLLYLAAIGGPAAWLGHLAVLGRPAEETTSEPDNERDGAMEWYPLGRILAWAAFFGGTSLTLTFARTGFDLETYSEPLKKLIAALLNESRSLTGGEGVARSEFVDSLAYALPLAASMLWTATMLFNLWLAGRVVRRSGQLPRPWPDLSAIELPPLFFAVSIGLFAAAILFGGSIGYVASFYVSAVAVLWISTGLAVLHATTRGRSFRGPLLTLTYATLLLFGWPAIPLIALGITDRLAGLRRRFGKPPVPSSPSS